ncbi:hypothetical protein OD91_2417 [Lutibacter sp. Hel_I_33_5]|uniref:hypothetical protein n=1 Tax=Lutibacter sp. Hel_I_33_5 TaxID=1566289 RepID=UPI0011A17BBB|nr:hypothetical protein [Lutibacter sp. Hel_I_33_5]TVZ57111.1 hypothetical protein OD91_2417 [Lutibacter sp. Hel_I_33_5]
MYLYKKAIIINLLIFITSISFAQTDTEIHLFDIEKTGSEFKLKNGKNISKNPGYDNQPHFYNSNTVLFASTRNKQNDIVKYNIKTGKTAFINNTPNGGEYSPQRIPKSRDFSAVRLDTDGLQRFYKYDIKTGKSKELIADLKVAYPMWYKKKTVISIVIVDDNLDLMINKLKSKKNITIQKKVGRSLHKIPNSILVSYISKQNDLWEIRSLNPKTKETKKIINSIDKKEDICWLPDGTLLLANNNKLMKFNPKTDTDWSVFHTFSKNTHKIISRILVNKKGTKLALVSSN